MESLGVFTRLGGRDFSLRRRRGSGVACCVLFVVAQCRLFWEYAYCMFEENIVWIFGGELSWVVYCNGSAFGRYWIDRKLLGY